jgi:hypothetical protein
VRVSRECEFVWRALFYDPAMLVTAFANVEAVSKMSARESQVSVRVPQVMALVLGESEGISNSLCRASQR